MLHLWPSPLLLPTAARSLAGVAQPVPEGSWANRDGVTALQVRRMRRCVPRWVSAESSAVSSLRSPRAAPQEAVVLLVSRRRRLLPAVPGHLRTTHKRWGGQGKDGTPRWTKCLFQQRRMSHSGGSVWCSIRFVFVHQPAEELLLQQAVKTELSVQYVSITFHTPPRPTPTTS